MDNGDKAFTNERLDGVSVVIPTYNRPDYIKRMLTSITKQTLPVDEVIIVNDCSPNIEQYEAVIKEFKGILNVKHIVAEKNQGAPSCRNQGIKLSKYKYIALTDDDDEWTPQKNEEEYERIKKGDVGLVYSHGTAVDEQGNIVYEFKGSGCGKDLKSLLRECFIPSSSVMVTYEAIAKANFFDPQMPSCQDWDMWVRILEKGYSYDVIKKPLLIYHIHGGESIGTSLKAAEGYRRFYRKHYKQYIKMFLFTGEYKKCLHAIKIALLKN